ncbi:hypothetical protein C7M84_018136 [Penaeus vannamei]|uniref:Uncharacterized protein n=1 Tax=Penaeus vannamei TaxID=6689 RepID=A0A423SI83_PENVA|nr:hypothetical protein C7M84_018136 [Penaeus vannamei]
MKVDHPVVVGAGRLSPHDRGAGAVRPRAAVRPRGQGRQPLRRPRQPGLPQSLPRFRGREPERQGLPHGGGGHARCRLRPRPERAQGAGEPKPPARGLSARALSQHDRKQGPLLRHAQGEDALRTPHHPRPGGPPCSCRRGPTQPTRPRGRGRSAPGAREGSPSDGPGSQASPKACPAFGDGSRRGRGFLTAAGARPLPPPPPAREGAGGRRAQAARPGGGPPYSCRRGPSANTTANRAPSCATPRERTPSAPHHPRPGKRLTFSRVEGGEQRAPSRQPRCTASCPRPPRSPAGPEGGLLGPAPDPRGTRARLAAFQPSPARRHHEGGDHPVVVGAGRLSTRPRAGPFGPGGQGRQPLRRPRQPGLPQSLARFRGREPERQGLPHGRAGTPAPAAAASAPGPRGRRGRRAQAARPGGQESPSPPARRARPNQQGDPAPPVQGPRRPRRRTRRGARRPPARSRGSPPVVVGAGPSATHDRAQGPPSPVGRPGQRPVGVRQGHAESHAAASAREGARGR